MASTTCTRCGCTAVTMPIPSSPLVFSPAHHTVWSYFTRQLRWWPTTTSVPLCSHVPFVQTALLLHPTSLEQHASPTPPHDGGRSTHVPPRCSPAPGSKRKPLSHA